MSINGNKKKDLQLGTSHGAASNRLRKLILFSLVKELHRDVCFQCGEIIEDVDNFSIEHKEPWLDSDDPISKFFDINNIAFSHLDCNVNAHRISNKGQVAPHGTVSRYVNPHNCRCDECCKAKARSDKIYGHRDRHRGQV